MAENRNNYFNLTQFPHYQNSSDLYFNHFYKNVKYEVLGEISFSNRF